LIGITITYAQETPTWCLKVGTADGKYSGTDSEVTVIIYNDDTSLSRILKDWATNGLESGATDTYYLCGAGTAGCFATDGANLPRHIGFQNFDRDGWQMEWYQVYLSASSDCRFSAGPAILHGFYNADGPHYIWLDGDGNQQEFFNTIASEFPTDEHGYGPAFATGTRQQCYKDGESVDCMYE
jgi:hypothetical protein